LYLSGGISKYTQCQGIVEENGKTKNGLRDEVPRRAQSQRVVFKERAEPQNAISKFQH